METTMINQVKEFDAVKLMHEIRNVLNEYINNMSFIEQKKFIKCLITDKEFVKQIIEKYKIPLTWYCK